MAGSAGANRGEVPDDGARCSGIAWQTDPGSGWSVEDLEALIAAGVRVVGGDERPDGDDDGLGRWLDDLVNPEHGPVAWLGERTPSGAMLADLETWAEAEVVTDYDALEVVAQWSRLEAYCAAGKRRAAAVLARRDALAGGLAHLEGHDILVGEVSIAADELALRIGVTKPAARRLVRSGRVMSGAGVLTAEALESGEIDAVKADAILEAIEDLGPDAALAVQERVLAKAGYLSAGGVRRELAVACAAVNPPEFEFLCEQAAKTRRVNVPRVLPHGMASLYAVLPAVEATEIYRALDAAARSGKADGDPRTLEQLRADALAAMGAAALQTGWIGPAPSGVPPDQAGVLVGHGGGVERDGEQVGDGADGGPLHCGPIRVGVIGGHHAHVRVVVPYTMLMDADPALSGTGPVQQTAADAERAGPDARGDGYGSAHAAASGPPTLGDPPTSGDPPALNAPPTAADPRAVSELPTAFDPAPVCDPRAVVVRRHAPLEPGLPLHETASPDLLGIAHLDGYGPIPAAVARALAAGGTWARMVVDPVNRTVLELSRATYKPPQSMVDLVTAAQPRCARPGCEVGADSCDIHHRIPWPVGATEPGNLDPDCRRDHLLLTHGGWAYKQDESDYSRTWTTSTGHRYTVTLDGEIRLLPRTVRPDDPPPF